MLEGEILAPARSVVSAALIVHEDPLLRERVSSVVKSVGVRVHEHAELEETLAATAARPAVSVILVSARFLRSPERTTPQIIAALRSAGGTEEILVLADSPPALAVARAAVSAGVSALIRIEGGQIDEPALSRHVFQAIQRHAERSRRYNAHLDTDVFERQGLIARSPAMVRFLSKAVRAARISDVPILLYGESGTGKQLLAETIHRLDAKRSGRRFLSVNCASISGTLADSELFGHVKGAFTGATEDRLGCFRAADGGTLLLDEIGELDLALQPKLLRVLQEARVLPVGADEEVDVDVRVIAATHRRLPAMVGQSTFRLDLYQRLNVIVLEIPPLRERPEDIPAMVQCFVRKYANYYPAPIHAIDPELYRLLSRQPLAGNVRELENTVRQMLAFKTEGDSLGPADLEALGWNLGTGVEDTGSLTTELVERGHRLIEQGRMSLPALMDELEARLLREAMRNSTGTTVELAKHLGLSRRTLYNKLRKFDL